MHASSHRSPQDPHREAHHFAARDHGATDAGGTGGAVRSSPVQKLKSFMRGDIAGSGSQMDFCGSSDGDIKQSRRSSVESHERSSRRSLELVTQIRASLSAVLPKGLKSPPQSPTTSETPSFTACRSPRCLSDDEIAQNIERIRQANPALPSWHEIEAEDIATHPVAGGDRSSVATSVSDFSNSPVAPVGWDSTGSPAPGPMNSFGPETTPAYFSWVYQHAPYQSQGYEPEATATRMLAGATAGIPKQEAGEGLSADTRYGQGRVQMQTSGQPFSCMELKTRNLDGTHLPLPAKTTMLEQKPEVMELSQRLAPILQAQQMPPMRPARKVVRHEAKPSKKPPSSKAVNKAVGKQAIAWQMSPEQQQLLLQQQVAAMQHWALRQAPAAGDGAQPDAIGGGAAGTESQREPVAAADAHPLGHATNHSRHADAGEGFPRSDDPGCEAQAQVPPDGIPGTSAMADPANASHLTSQAVLQALPSTTRSIHEAQHSTKTSMQSGVYSPPASEQKLAQQQQMTWPQNQFAHQPLCPGGLPPEVASRSTIQLPWQNETCLVEKPSRETDKDGLTPEELRKWQLERLLSKLQFTR